MTPLGPELITQIGGFKITNTLVSTLTTDVVLLSLVYFVHKHISIIPGKIQSIFETGVSYFYDLTLQLTGKERETNAIFPWVMTFFLIIFLTNILGLMPGVGSIGFFPKHEEVVTQEHSASTEAVKPKENAHETEFIPLLRPATSDFNATLALAFISLIATHALSIKYTGIKDYLMRFFSLNPVLLFVGILELVSEFIKMVSLSFRLYGNIFAGEVALHTVSTLHPLSAFLVPIPFLLLETIVAIVQALVFAMLTMVFMSIMITPHHAEH